MYSNNNILFRTRGSHDPQKIELNLDLIWTLWTKFGQEKNQNFKYHNRTNLLVWTFSQSLEKFRHYGQVRQNLNLIQSLFRQSLDKIWKNFRQTSDKNGSSQEDIVPFLDLRLANISGNI